MLELSQVSPSFSEANLRRAQAAWATFHQTADKPGFFHLPDDSQIWESSREAAERLWPDFDRLVVIGIGGSALGGRALVEALGSADRPVEFFENIDEHHLIQQLAGLPKLETTHFCIISKTGRTAETLALAQLVDSHLNSRRLNLADQCTVITGPKSSALRDWAQAYKVPCLDVPESVGGRFSVLSPVGLLPAAFSGIAMGKLREGARLGMTSEKLVTELTALTLDSFEREEWITLFWCYSYRWLGFAAWLQQLWAESLAKAKTHSGSAAPRVSSPFYCLGAVDQHSLLQQVVEGARDKWVWFFRDTESEGRDLIFEKQGRFGQTHMENKSLGDLMRAEAQATQMCLEEVGVSHLSFQPQKLDARTLGGAFVQMELIVSLIGTLHNINTYDQPGVERGKVLARKIITQDH